MVTSFTGSAIVPERKRQREWEWERQQEREREREQAHKEEEDKKEKQVQQLTADVKQHARLGRHELVGAVRDAYRGIYSRINSKDLLKEMSVCRSRDPYVKYRSC